MCLLIFAHRANERYPLIIAANRDEFHARPTASSEFWPQHPDLLAGRDLDQGGTWMGITRGGRFAAITNYRDPARTAPAPRSRGELPLNYLIGTMEPRTYLEELADQASQYAGFSLLVGDSQQLWFFSNDGSAGPPRSLPPGIYGLSNASLDTPWPKLTRGKARLSSLLESGAVPNHQQLLEVVGNRDLADPGELRQQGLDSSMDQLLSAQFIVTGTYGTRSSTSLWTDSNGLAHWQELSFDERGVTVGQSDKEFELLAPRPGDCG